MNKVGIVAFALGMPQTITSNQQIAAITTQRALELGAPVYTQTLVNVGEGVDVEYTNEPNGPWPTLRIARGAVAWAVKNQLAELLVVAATPHMARALKDVQLAVRESKAAIRVQRCQEVEQFRDDSWYCPDSLQPWTRFWWAWRGRELILWLMPTFLYKRIAN